MALTMADKMILNGAPALWAAPLSEGVGGLTLGTMQKYDNITTPVFTFAGSAAAAGGAAEEFIQVTRADGAIIEFPKGKLTLDGIDETVKDSSGATAAGDSKATGTLQITVNEAEMGSASFSAWLNTMLGNINSFWLVCIPLGYNWKQRHPSSATAHNAVGYLFLIGKLSGNVAFTVAPQTGAPIPLTWQGQKLTVQDLAAASAAIAAAVFDPIPVKGITPAVTLAPTAGLTATEAEDLLKGTVIIK